MLIGRDKGYIEVLTGPEGNQIRMLSKLKIESLDCDIMNLMLTNRSTDKSLDIAISTE